jgi:hypothetical protein
MYGCFKAYSTVIRFSGSKMRNFFNKSIAYGGAKLNNLEKSLPFFLFFGKLFINFLLSSGMCLILSRSGVPRYSQMSYIWFLVSVPGKNGFLCNIYAKIQPTLHISTEVVYWAALNNNSGARYHLVATY